METLSLPEVTDLQPIASLKRLELPFIGSLIKGGFPNPADTFFRNAIDLNDIIIKYPNSTYYGAAWSDSMEPLIPEGSILIVCRRIESMNGKIVVAEVDGNLCMKRFFKKNGRIEFHSENPKYSPVVIKEGMTCTIFGVVTHVIDIL